MKVQVKCHGCGKPLRAMNSMAANHPNFCFSCSEKKRIEADAARIAKMEAEATEGV